MLKRLIENYRAADPRTHLREEDDQYALCGRPGPWQHDAEKQREMKRCPDCATAHSFRPKAKR